MNINNVQLTYLLFAVFAVILVIASSIGLNFDFVCDKYQASGRLIKNKIKVVIAANLKEIIKGENSIVFNNSII